MAHDFDNTLDAVSQSAHVFKKPDQIFAFAADDVPHLFGKCANLSWKLKRLQTLWFDGIGRNNIKPVRERSRDEESVTFGEKTQEEASTG